MFRKRSGRVSAAIAAVTAVFALAASPALAHFCSKSGWSDAALANAPKSQAWLTASEWLAFIAAAETAGEICPAGANDLRAQIATRSADTLFLGPGLLAGGTLKNGKENTPDHFAYLDFESAFGACS